jgi:DivIVA domain-containing protein
MTPDDVRNARFAAVRRGGYETQEVDAFLAESVEALEAGDGRMTPEDVRDARFTLVKRGGYDTQEVDAFLDELMEEFDRRGAEAHRDSDATPAGERERPAFQPAPEPKRPPMAVPGPAVAAEPGAAPEREPAPAREPSSAQAAPPKVIAAAQLRRLTPPSVDADGYDTTAVDAMLEAVADTLDVLEGLEGDALDEERGRQYLLAVDGRAMLLTGDHVRAARFPVRAGGGYDQRGIDAAMKRLGVALDHHWRR